MKIVASALWRTFTVWQELAARETRPALKPDATAILGKLLVH